MKKKMKVLIFLIVFIKLFNFWNAESYIFDTPIYNDIKKYVNYNADLIWDELIKWNNENAELFCYFQKWTLINYWTDSTYTNDIVYYNTNDKKYIINNSDSEFIKTIICDIEKLKLVEKYSFMTIKELEGIYQMELVIILLFTIIMLIVKMLFRKYKIKVKF